VGKWRRKRIESCRIGKDWKDWSIDLWREYKPSWSVLLLLCVFGFSMVIAHVANVSGI
jgi:hypothetical protein